MDISPRPEHNESVEYELYNNSMNDEKANVEVPFWLKSSNRLAVAKGQVNMSDSLMQDMIND
jgi:hypothetical protein